MQTLSTPPSAPAPGPSPLTDWHHLLPTRHAPAASDLPRLRVQAFGALRIERDGVPLEPEGKAPRKPLELLALLVAQGGRALDASEVIDELWPSLDAEAPRASLDMAVSRLRRLLGQPEALRFSGGRLWLDPQRLWCDVAAFETLRLAADAGSERAPWQALALYHEPLLGGSTIGGRLLVRRQQLARQLCDLALTAAQRLQACGAADQAARLLQRALDCEPLCEPLHRALMQAQLALGERAEVLRTWLGCDMLLRTRLGVAPTAATAALAALARAG